MKAKSINTTALLLKTLLLAGFIIFTVKSGMAQTTWYRIGGGDQDVKDGNFWSATSGGTPIGVTIIWTANDIMIIDGNSGTSPIGLKFSVSYEVASLQISGNKTVTISSIDGNTPLTLTLSGANPISIASSSSLKLNDKDKTLNISRASGANATIAGTIWNGDQTNTSLIIGPNTSLTTSMPIRGLSTTSSISNVTIYGTLTTSNYINSADFKIENGGKLNTSYGGTEGWWNQTTKPTSGYINGTVEFNRNTGDQIISAPFSYGNIIFSGSSTAVKKIKDQNNIVCTGTVTIKSGVKVEMSSTSSLKVDGTLVNNNTSMTGLVLKSGPYTYIDENDQEITYVSTAQLMHNTSGIKATVERYIANDQKWHFLSSPVNSQIIWPEFAPEPVDGTWGEYDPLNPYNWDFYYYNPNALTTSQLYWVNLRKPDGSYNDGADMETGSLAGYGTGTPEFISGRGYLVAYNTDWNLITESPNTHIFAGNLHSGEISVPVVAMEGNTFNLIGNPFPSSIDWKAASGWTRNNLIESNGGFDYWIYNDAGTGNYGTFNSAGSTGTNGVSRHIAPGQAFFVKARGSGSIIMNDNIRNVSAQLWLKNSDTENNLIKLKLTSTANTYSDEMIVEFNPQFTGGGTDKFWSFYTEAPELYSVKDDNNYSIDRYNSLADDMKVNIAAKTGIAANYTITATNIADFTLRDKVYLLDLKTGVKTNLKQTPSYSFAGTPDDDRNRFQLIFGTSTGVDEENSSDITIYASENIIYVRNDKANEPYTVMVSNMLGQIITRTKLAGNSLNQIELNSVPGIYVVTVYSEGCLFSKKVVVK